MNSSHKCKGCCHRSRCYVDTTIRNWLELLCFFFTADIFLSHLNVVVVVVVYIVWALLYSICPFIFFSFFSFGTRLYFYFHICFHYSIILNRISDIAFVHSLLLHNLFRNAMAKEIQHKKFPYSLFFSRVGIRVRVCVCVKNDRIFCCLSEITKGKTPTTTQKEEEEVRMKPTV